MNTPNARKRRDTQGWKQPAANFTLEKKVRVWVYLEFN